MKKLLLLANERAGQGHAKDSIYDIVHNFTKEGYESTVRLIMSSERTPMIREEDDYDLVVCCGGDGTLHVLVNQMIA